MARRRVIDAVIADSATMSISTIVNGAAGAVAGDPARPMTMRGFPSWTGGRSPGTSEMSAAIARYCSTTRGGGVDVGDKLTERVDAHSVSLACSSRAAVSASSQLQSLYKA